jgi:uncharacterized repeat protein (TIGR01451 family)
MKRNLRRLCSSVAALAVLAGLPAMGPWAAASAGPAAAAAAPDPATCPQRVALVNGGIEQPTVTGGAVNFFPDAAQGKPNSVPGWLTTATDHEIEVWTAPPNPTNTPPAQGKQFAELNANQVSTLYQDQPTTPGATLYWRLSHRGRQGADTMALDIGAPGAPVPQKTMTDGTTAWGTYTGTYTVPPGQTTTRFAFRSVSSVGGPTIGNFLDDVFFGTAPCVVVTKTAVPDGPVSVGDVITYRLTAKNQGGGVAENARLTDAVPTGTTYVPGSLRVVDGPNAGAKTDKQGDDQAKFDGTANEVSFALGNGATAQSPGRLPNTSELPDGTTVEFRVRIDRAAAGKQVTNTGEVGYENSLGATPEPLTSSTGDVTTTVRPAADLGVVKSADLTKVTVGQTVSYRIGIHNAGPNAATGVTVDDQLPANLAFVSATPSAGSYDPGTGTWKVGDLAADGAATLTIRAKATMSGDQVNTVTVDGNEDDFNAANDTDAVTICVTPAPPCRNCGAARCPDCPAQG